MIEHAVTYLEAHSSCKLYVVVGFPYGELVKSASSKGVLEEPELNNSHEEADTRMMLHAVVADEDFGSRGVSGTIIIRSPDTGVLVLAVPLLSKAANYKFHVD